MVGLNIDTQSNNELRGCNCKTKMVKCVMGFCIVTSM